LFKEKSKYKDEKKFLASVFQVKNLTIFNTQK
jgi:hypothetical protein